MRDLLEHLVEAHVDDGVAFDELLELLDDGRERPRVLLLRATVDLPDVLVEPLLELAVVLWQPLPNAVVGLHSLRDALQVRVIGEVVVMSFVRRVWFGMHLAVNRDELGTGEVSFRGRDLVYLAIYIYNGRGAEARGGRHR